MTQTNCLILLMMSQMKLLFPLLLATFVISSVTYADDPIDVAKPLQSSNSVMYNDCNLRLTNPDLLLKRLGNDATQSFWTYNDVVFAHLKTVLDIQCGGVAGILFADEFGASLVDNLCTV